MEPVRLGGECITSWIFEILVNAHIRSQFGAIPPCSTQHSGRRNVIQTDRNCEECCMPVGLQPTSDGFQASFEELTC